MHQEPAGEPHVHPVLGVAGRRLGDLGVERLHVAQQQRPERSTPLEGRPQLVCPDAPGGRFHLDHGLGGRALGAEEGRQTGQPLAADEADLDAVAVIQRDDVGDHPALGKVDGLDCPTGLVEDLLQLQLGRLKVIRQGGEVGRRQGGEKPVADGGLLDRHAFTRRHILWHAIVRLPDCGPLVDKHEQASAGLLVIADQLLGLGEQDRVTNGGCGDVHVDSQEPPQRRLVPQVRQSAQTVYGKRPASTQLKAAPGAGKGSAAFLGSLRCDLHSLPRCPMLNHLF